MKMDTDEETVYVVVGKGGPDNYFKILGVFDNRDSADICYAVSSYYDTYHFGVFELPVESQFTDALADWKNQKENETLKQWNERMEPESRK